MSTLTFKQYVAKVQQTLTALRASATNIPLSEVGVYYESGDTPEQFAHDWFQHLSVSRTPKTVPTKKHLSSVRPEVDEAARDLIDTYGKMGAHTRLLAQIEHADHGSGERKYLVSLYQAMAKRACVGAA